MRPWIEARTSLALLGAILATPVYSTAQSSRSDGKPSHAMTMAGNRVTPVVAGHRHPVPEFGTSSTIQSVRTGLWSDPKTWSPSRLPTTGDRVRIARDIHVGYDRVSDEALDCVTVESGGLLEVHPSTDTRLVVGTLVVQEGGHFRVGSADRPVSPEVRAEIVIADRALDLDDDGQGVYDPEQLGTGFLCWGRVTIFGAPRTPTFARLASEPKVGDTTLTLEVAPSGWRPGDRLVLPESRQVYAGLDAPNDGLRWETPTVREVEGATITLESPLRFDHPGARDTDGVLRLLPHVANLTRNVVIRSANPEGIRGHVMMTGRAQVDIRHALFRDLGRSLNSQRVEVAEHDREGHLVSVAKNQIGRYSLHMHHLAGPERTPAGGYQFTLVGNAVDGGDGLNDHRWGIVVHASHFGLIQGNVVYNLAGAGVSTEDGSELGNHFLENIVLRTEGLGHTDYGRISQQGRLHDFGHAGDGFWISGPSNVLRDNVAVGSRGSGFNFYASEFLEPSFHIPRLPGGDIHDPAQSLVVPAAEMPFGRFAGNEAYASSEAGLRIRFARKLRKTARFEAMRVWHSRFGVVGDNVPPSIFDRFVVLGDPSRARDRGESFGFFLGKVAEDVVVRGAEVQGVGVGLVPPTHTTDAPRFVVDPALLQGVAVDLEGSFLAEGCTFRNNRTDVRVDNNPTSAGLIYDDRRVVLRSCRFSHASTPGYLAIEARLSNLKKEFDLRRRQEILVEDFDGVASDDFQVFFPQQATDFVMPATSKTLLGAPEAGLTNGEVWSRYQIAIGGQIAPAEAAPRPEVGGLVVIASEPPSRDTRPPVVSELRVWPISGDEADITWRTDELADTRIYHGRGWFGPDGSESSGYSVAHRLRVKRYSPAPGYQLTVLARDIAGNASTLSWEPPPAAALEAERGDTTPDPRFRSTRRAPRAGQDTPAEAPR